MNPLKLLAIAAAPVFSLAGLIAAVYFRARTDSPQKKQLGSIGIVVGIGALLFSFLLVIGMTAAFGGMGAG